MARNPATKERPYTQEMVMVHRVFRRELRLLPNLIRNVGPDDPGRVALLAEATGDLLTGLHVHHHGEDELLWPRLLERVRLGDDLIARMQQQHTQVALARENAVALLNRWSHGGDPWVANQVADSLDALAEVLNVHLVEEEKLILPLAAEHLSVAEWNMLGEHALADIGKAKLLMTLGAILEDATPEEQAYFMGKVPLPGRLAWRLVGRRRYRQLVARRRGAQ